jgi:hypothetical protein
VFSGTLLFLIEETMTKMLNDEQLK